MNNCTRRLLSDLIEQYPPLKPDQEIDLIMRNYGDKDKLRELLVLHNVHLILYMMKLFHVRESSKDDFVSDCFLGLQKASYGFQTYTGKRFGNYAISAMRNEIFQTWKNERKYEDDYDFVRIDAILDDDKDNVDLISEWVRLNIDGKVEGDIEEELKDFDNETVTGNIRTFIRNSKTVSDNSKAVFEMLFENEMNNAVVARLSGKSRQRIAQIRDNVLSLIRKEYKRFL